MRGTHTTRLRLAGAAVMSAALSGLIWWALPDEAVYSPWWTQVFGWPAALLVRVDQVQRWLGSGRLDNRLWLRLTIAGVLFAATIATTGVSFLFPVFAALVASVHLQWSGARAWRPCAVMTLVLSATLQGAVQAGWLPSHLPRSLDLVAAVITLVLSLLLIGNVAVIAAQREAETAALDLERRSRHDALLHAATHDALTGRLNRVGLQEHFTRYAGDPASRGTRPQGLESRGADQSAAAVTPEVDAVSEVAVLYIDLDHFKPVNDQHGHAAGDSLLRLAADRMAALLRPGDGLARLGGDEFVAVLGTADVAVVAEVAARAGAALRSPFDLDGTMVRVSASIGTAVSTEAATLDELLRRADAAMYAAKTRHNRDRTPSADHES